MKLRLKGNSIRLRLTQSEVGRVAGGARIEETCEFSTGGRFTWALESGEGSCVAASLIGTQITVSVPVAMIRDWAGSDRVGIYATSAGVEIAIEKDFRCLTPRADELDAFPNPATAC